MRKRSLSTARHGIRVARSLLSASSPTRPAVASISSSVGALVDLAPPVTRAALAALASLQADSLSLSSASAAALYTLIVLYDLIPVACACAVAATLIAGAANAIQPPPAYCGPDTTHSSELEDDDGDDDDVDAATHHAALIQGIAVLMASVLTTAVTTVDSYVVGIIFWRSPLRSLFALSISLGLASSVVVLPVAAWPWITRAALLAAGAAFFRGSWLIDLQAWLEPCLPRSSSSPDSALTTNDTDALSSSSSSSSSSRKARAPPPSPPPPVQEFQCRVRVTDTPDGLAASMSDIPPADDAPFDWEASGVLHVISDADFIVFTSLEESVGSSPAAAGLSHKIMFGAITSVKDDHGRVRVSRRFLRIVTDTQVWRIFGLPKATRKALRDTCTARMS